MFALIQVKNNTYRSDGGFFKCTGKFILFANKARLHVKLYNE